MCCSTTWLEHEPVPDHEQGDRKCEAQDPIRHTRRIVAAEHDAGQRAGQEQAEQMRVYRTDEPMANPRRRAV